MSDDISVGEISRQMKDVLQRFEALINKIDSTFVSRVVWELYTLGLNQQLADIKQDIGEKAATADTATLHAELDKRVSKTAYDALEKRVANMEATQTWITRLVGAFIIIGILGVVFVTGSKP